MGDDDNTGEPMITVRADDLQAALDEVELLQTEAGISPRFADALGRLGPALTTDNVTVECWFTREQFDWLCNGGDRPHTAMNAAEKVYYGTETMDELVQRLVAERMSETANTQGRVRVSVGLSQAQYDFLIDGWYQPGGPTGGDAAAVLLHWVRTTMADDAEPMPR